MLSIAWNFILVISVVQISFGLRNAFTLRGKGHTISMVTNEKLKKPLRILLLVEPTPFTYVSGYANRFKEMLNYFGESGDSVHILTPDRNPAAAPTEYSGSNFSFPITTVRGFEFPLYNQVTLSFDFGMKTTRLIQEFKPDILHVATPSALVWPATLWAKVHQIPLVMSYHTHFVEYGKAYVPLPGSAALAAFLVRSFHSQADLTLCTSPQLKDSLEELGVKNVDVWQKGIDSQVGSFSCQAVHTIPSFSSSGQCCLPPTLCFAAFLSSLQDCEDARALVGRGRRGPSPLVCRPLGQREARGSAQACAGGQPHCTPRPSGHRSVRKGTEGDIQRI